MGVRNGLAAFGVAFLIGTLVVSPAVGVWLVLVAVLCGGAAFAQSRPGVRRARPDRVGVRAAWSGWRSGGAAGSRHVRAQRASGGGAGVGGWRGRAAGAGGRLRGAFGARRVKAATYEFTDDKPAAASVGATASPGKTETATDANGGTEGPGVPGVHDTAADAADNKDDPGADASGDGGDLPAAVDTEGTDMSSTKTLGFAPAIYGTAGRGATSGLVADWETSMDARRDPETFVAWLRQQAAESRQRGAMVPDLVSQFHGRGPNDAGVPEEILGGFMASYADSANAEADAYEQWASDYAAHVADAMAEMQSRFGREVIGAAAEPGSAAA